MVWVDFELSHAAVDNRVSNAWATGSNARASKGRAGCAQKLGAKEVPDVAHGVAANLERVDLHEGARIA